MPAGESGGTEAKREGDEIVSDLVHIDGIVEIIIIIA